MRLSFPILRFTAVLVALTPHTYGELPAEKERTVFIPYWSLEAGFESTIHLHNNLAKDSLTVTPVLFSYTGQAVELSDVQLRPLGNASLDLGKQTVSGLTGAKYGSAGIRYKGRFEGALLGEISVVHRGKSLGYTVVGSHSGPTDPNQHTVFWFPSRKSEFYASLFNSSSKTIRVTPSLQVNGKTIGLPAVTVPGKHTRVIELPEDLPDVSSFLATMREGGDAGGFSLLHDGVPGALIASGWIEDKTTGYSTMATFQETAGAQSSTLVAAQILEGIQPDLVPGRRISVRSRLVLRNLTERIASIRGEIAQTIGGQFSIEAFPAVSLQPREVRVIEVGDLVRTRATSSEISLKIEHDAGPGGILGRVFGISQNKEYGFYWALESNAGRTYNELFWSAEPGWNTILSVVNAGDTADDVMITFTANEGVFSLPPKTLAPLQSYTIMSAPVVQARGGRPPTSGGFKITGSSKQSRLVVKEHVIDGTSGISTPYYGSYTYVYYLSIFPSPMELDVTYTNGYFFDTTQYWSDGQSSPDCGWVSSRNTSVATASKSWQCQNTAAPVSQGTTYIDAQSESVPINSSGTIGVLTQAAQVKVRRPHHVSYISTTSQGNANCPPGMAGWSRLVTLELRADDNNAYRQSGITMADAITVQATNQLGIGNTSTGSFSTNSAGRWPDSYFVCSSACPGSSGRTDAIQSWTWNSIALLQANFVVYRCNSVTIDGQ